MSSRSALQTPASVHPRPRRGSQNSLLMDGEQGLMGGCDLILLALSATDVHPVNIRPGTSCSRGQT